MRRIVWLIVGATACGASDPGPVVTGDLYLAVMNVGGNCSVTIGSGQPSTAPDDEVADYDPDQTIALTASALPGFTLGVWHHTDGDTGSGDSGTVVDEGNVETSSTTVTLTDVPGCVWICCSSAAGACPTTDPCR